jgi:uncharacterized metal-binding protein YceD (DUF177 family)
VKIPFSKVTPHTKTFLYKKDFLTFESELHRVNRERVFLRGRIFGKIALICDRCAEEFFEDVEWSIELTLSNRVVKSEKDLDIIEFINSDIDFETILDSEANSYRLLYHHCKKCLGDGEFNMEF